MSVSIGSILWGAGLSTLRGELFAEFFAGESEAAFGRREVGFHGLSDFGEAQAGEVMQCERQPLLEGEALQQVFDERGDFAAIGEFVGGNDVGDGAGQEIVGVIGRAADGAHQGVVRTPARVIDQQIPGDAEHPASKAAAGEVVPRLAEDAEQRVLGQVFGELAIVGLTDEEAEQRALMAFDQVVEGAAVSFLQAEHQFIVDVSER
jgi:hypothetical protein